MWMIHKSTEVYYSYSILTNENDKKHYREIKRTSYDINIDDKITFTIILNEDGESIYELGLDPLMLFEQLNEIETLFIKPKIIKLLKEYITEERIEDFKTEERYTALEFDKIDKLLEIINSED